MGDYHADNHVFKEFCQGLTPSVENVYDRCYPAIRKLVKKNRGKKEDADDVFQEGILILLMYCKRPSFVLNKPLCGFLYAICARIWWKKLKKRGRLKVTFSDFSEYIGLQHVIELQQEEEKKAERFRLMWKNLNRLPEREQRVLKLYYLEGKSHREIAEIVGFSDENSAKVQKSKYMKRLRDLTRKDPDFE